MAGLTVISVGSLLTFTVTLTSFERYLSDSASLIVMLVLPPLIAVMFPFVALTVAIEESQLT